MKKRLTIILVMFALVFACLLPASTALAADPQVTITVSATVISITNGQASWALGVVDVDAVKYFSADNTQDDNYSLITNTGNAAVDIELQGTDFEGGAYDWTLGAAAGNQTYSLYANSGNGSSTYDIEVKSSAYTDLILSLAASDIYDWSMNFTAPDEFNASDAGSEKSANVTLVASKS